MERLLFEGRSLSNLARKWLVSELASINTAGFDIRVQKQYSCRVCAAYIPASRNHGLTHNCRLVRRTEECLTHQKCQWAAIRSKHRAQPILQQQAFPPAASERGAEPLKMPLRRGQSEKILARFSCPFILGSSAFQPQNHLQDL